MLIRNNKILIKLWSRIDRGVGVGVGVSFGVHCLYTREKCLYTLEKFILFGWHLFQIIIPPVPDNDGFKRKNIESSSARFYNRGLGIQNKI